MDDPLSEPLTPAALARREAIRRLAQRFAARKRWRRRAGRSALASILVIAGVWRAWPVHPAPERHPMAIARPPQPPTSRPVMSVVTFVQTDPTITARWSIAPSPPRWVMIDDHQLLAALADAGRPAGLITMDGHARLLFHASPIR